MTQYLAHIFVALREAPPHVQSSLPMCLRRRFQEVLKACTIELNIRWLNSTFR